MTISKRTAAGLEEVLRTLLLDSENKVPAERLRIVGALSAGAIIERGSNANGEYIRWTDGTQVCYRTVVTRNDLSASVASMSDELGRYLIQLTYPAAFVGVPTVATCGGQNQTNYGFTDAVTILSTGFNLCIFAKKNFSTLTIAVYGYLAIGKWK